MSTATVSSSAALVTCNRTPDLTKLSDDTLIELLKGVIALETECISQGGRLIREAERRGLDLQAAGIGKGYLRYLRRVARGQLLPELVKDYLGTALLPKIIGLPIRDQERVAADKEFDVAIIQNGRPTVVKMKPSNMRPRIASTVFAEDHVRTEEEQYAYLRAQQVALPAATTAKYRVDAKKAGIWVTDTGFISQADLRKSVQALGF